METNFKLFKSEIWKCLLKMDVNYFIHDLKILFTERSYRCLIDSNYDNKVELFLSEFEKLENTKDKFNLFMNSAKEHNKWIYDFLTVDINNEDEVQNLIGHWVVLQNLLDMLKNANKHLWVINNELIYSLCSEEIITVANKDYLMCRLKEYGEKTAMFELFDVITARTSDWYGVVLCMIAQQNTAFFNMISKAFDMELDDCTTVEAKKRKIMDYSRKFVEDHITRYRKENQLMDDKSDCGVEDMSWDEAESSAATMMDINANDFDDDLDTTSWFNDEEMKTDKLTMKSFQLELAAHAVSGKNVIIYAPTGIGKTIVAIYIANEHLRNNPTGKVAFLVPRRHLVDQQHAAFEKYKDPYLNAVKLHGKSVSTTGPLKFHLEQCNQIFVMTGGIFYNALTVNDGNKISSISEFSLIFFDECHHCMKNSTYNQIMSEYINEKHQYPDKRLPQIVGLTASPRVNNSDDRRTMKAAVLELCANLDCQHFSFVKLNVSDLEQELVTPKQEVIKVTRRVCKNFESSLMKLMEQCEQKLEKMKNERYFNRSVCGVIPGDRSLQSYASFVGKLQHLNNDTIEQNDGKQKAYAIYRFLNAYYRGLIVHQLFNEFYAKECMDRHLFHDGKTFTCSYEEEFSKAYKANIVVSNQSNNPAIEIIKSLMQSQFEEKPNSRILIFVQQVAYTYYLVDLIRTSSKIDAEAIVGSNSKNDLKGCSGNDTNELLRRFRDGDFKVLVATSVVEEGLDVPHCNMVISYGYVTNEIALIQRLGRARSVDSKYCLVLPPMFYWMENKENINRRRNETMMTLIREYDQIDFNTPEVAESIMKYQMSLFNLNKKFTPSLATNQDSWHFNCKSCQKLICTSEELRILEKSHVVCINPDVIKNLEFVHKETREFGMYYVMVGSWLCQCRNNKLGKKVLYQKHPYFQVRIDRCTVTKDSKAHRFPKWKDFIARYTIPLISMEEMDYYISNTADIEN